MSDSTTGVRDTTQYRGYKLEEFATAEGTICIIYFRGEQVCMVESVAGAKALVDCWVEDAR